jgi:hypothetical protein
MKHRLIIVCIVIASWIPSFVMGQPVPAKSDLDAPIYGGASFQRYTETGNGVVVASYCSNASVNSILKYYRSVFKNALEIQAGSSGGPVNKIILDVSSPSDWRNARKFIEIYEDKKTVCSSIIRITVMKKQPDKEKPVIAGEATGVSDVRKDKAVTPASDRKKTIGVGGYVNTLNLSAGPTLILWPTKKFALQGSYGAGTFTSYEARGLYRFNPSSRLKPYFGVGYIHADKQATVIGVDTTISGDSFSVFGGIETSLYSKLYLYADVSATPMKLENDVISSTQRATATVEYSPVTIGTGVIFYLW